MSELHDRAADLEVPPEVLVANDVLTAYKALLEYAGWVHKHFETASDEAKAYRRGQVLVISAKLREYSETLLALEAERYG